jgi:hypothetical protein
LNLETPISRASAALVMMDGLEGIEQLRGFPLWH